MHKGPVKEYGGALTYSLMHRPIKMSPKQKRGKKEEKEEEDKGRKYTHFERKIVLCLEKLINENFTLFVL